MPIGTRPTRTLPPEPALPSMAADAPGSTPTDIDVFERAFAAADAASGVTGVTPNHAAPPRGFAAVIAGIGSGIVAALGGWLEPRCPTCQARGTVTLELRAVGAGEPSHLWEHCYACDNSWASVRCEDLSGWC